MQGIIPRENPKCLPGAVNHKIWKSLMGNKLKKKKQSKDPNKKTITVGINC